MMDHLLPLEERLFEQSYDFDFFQAVRLLHLILSDRTGVGRIAKPAEEPVRFQIRQSLEFPASSIHAISDEADPPRMTVAFEALMASGAPARIFSHQRSTSEPSFSGGTSALIRPSCKASCTEMRSEVRI